MPIFNRYEQFICLIKGNSLVKMFILFVTVMKKLKLFQHMAMGNIIIIEMKS